MQYKTIKISKVHDDCEALANGNAILHLIFTFARRSNLQFVIITVVTAYLNYSSPTLSSFRYKNGATNCDERCKNTREDIISFYDIFIIIKYSSFDAVSP